MKPFKNKQNYSLIESDSLDSELRILGGYFIKYAKINKSNLTENLQQ